MIARVSLLALGIVIGAGATYYFGSQALQRQQIHQQQVTQDQIDHAIRQAHINQEALQNKYNDLHAKSLLDQVTIEQLQNELTHSQDELDQAKEQLAFFQELAPASSNNRISLRGYSVKLQGQRIQFKVLLSQNGNPLNHFKGRLQFIAHGQREGKAVDLALYPEVQEGQTLIATDAPKDQQPPALKPVQDLKKDDLAPILNLDFERIQRSEGLLVVPDDFQVQQITLKVLEGNSVLLSQTQNLDADTP
ncbi:DUF6776 family protein [Brackiella oedipodis]|uniref:DUF6776 family protein n=1 Tax=Brackiella oedipodis TaxID=124225 RepID=UPI000490DD18|nr:DUF6776 family protein [Brackiella oedipodis]